MNKFIKNYININLYPRHKIIRKDDDTLWIEMFNDYPFYILFNAWEYYEGIINFSIINVNYDGTGYSYEYQLTYNINTDKLDDNTEFHLNVIYNEMRKYINKNKDFIGILVMLKDYIYESINK